MLPTTGDRSRIDGELFLRGVYGYYWSSSEAGSANAWYLLVGLSGASTYDYYRLDGLSLRCIAE